MFIQADIVQVRVVDHPLSHILWFLLSLGSRLTTSSPGLFGFRAFFDDSLHFFSEAFYRISQTSFFQILPTLANMKN